jgi:3-hydroxyacyl-[acyl-carrier-protein] dehydratase
MIERWHHLTILSGASLNSLSAETRLPPESPWFSGHFPGNPILPGVAVLAMVAEMVRYAEEKKKGKVRISGVKRVRFKQPVKPNELLFIEVSCDGADRVSSYFFKAMVRNEIACTGQMLVEGISAG